MSAVSKVGMSEPLARFGGGRDHLNSVATPSIPDDDGPVLSSADMAVDGATAAELLGAVGLDHPP